jgi:hypothetical protein
LFFVSFIRVALVVNPIFLVKLIAFLKTFFNFGCGTIVITVNFVKLFKAIMSYNASLIIIRNGAVSISLNVINLNFELILNLLKLFFIKLVDLF